MTSTLAKPKPLPIWSKALIAFVALGMVASLATVILGTALFKQQFDISSDPKSTAKLARTMILLPEPLPEDWRYVLGIDLWLFQVVAVDYDGGAQRYAFFSCPTREKMDANQMLTQTFEQGLIISGSSESRFVGVQSEGTWVFREDTQIPYRIGRLAGEEGGTGLVACVVDEPRKRALIIYGMQQKGEKFDTKPITTLLQSVDAQPSPEEIPAPVSAPVN